MNKNLEARAFAVTASDECEKLMSRYCYYYAGGKHREIYDRLFSKREDITITVNNGRYDNRYSIYQSFVLNQEQDAFDNYLAIMKRYPQAVTHVTDHRALDMFRKPLMHNMVFELAADGQSAKGLFYTTSYVYNCCRADGIRDCRWIMERHAADFVYEDGEWKILNLVINSDAEGRLDAYQWPLQHRVTPEFDLADDYDVPGVFHKPYTPVQVPQNTPAIPEPYETYSEENSYAAL